MEQLMGPISPPAVSPTRGRCPSGSHLWFPGIPADCFPWPSAGGYLGSIVVARQCKFTAYSAYAQAFAEAPPRKLPESQGSPPVTAKAQGLYLRSLQIRKAPLRSLQTRKPTKPAQSQA